MSTRLCFDNDIDQDKSALFDTVLPEFQQSKTKLHQEDFNDIDLLHSCCNSGEDTSYSSDKNLRNQQLQNCACGSKSEFSATANFPVKCGSIRNHTKCVWESEFTREEKRISLEEECDKSEQQLSPSLLFANCEEVANSSDTYLNKIKDNGHYHHTTPPEATTGESNNKDNIKSLVLAETERAKKKKSEEEGSHVIATTTSSTTSSQGKIEKERSNLHANSVRAEDPLHGNTSINLNDSCGLYQLPADKLDKRKDNYRTDAIRVIKNNSEQYPINTKAMKSTITIMGDNEREQKTNEIDQCMTLSFNNEVNDSCLLHKEDVALVAEENNCITNLKNSETANSVEIENKETFLSSSKNEIEDATCVVVGEENRLIDFGDIEQTYNESNNSDVMSPTRHQLSSVISDVLSGKNSDLTSSLFFTGTSSGSSVTKDTSSMFERGKVVYNAKNEDCNLVVSAKQNTENDVQTTKNNVSGERYLPDVLLNDNTLTASSSSSTLSTDSFEQEESDEDKGSLLLNADGNSKMALTKSTSLTGLDASSSSKQKQHYLLSGGSSIRNSDTRPVSMHEGSLHDKELIEALASVKIGGKTRAMTSPKPCSNVPTTSKSLEELDVGINASSIKAATSTTNVTGSSNGAGNSGPLATRVSALNRRFMNREFANAMLRKAVSLVEIQNERLKENVARWEKQFMSQEILSAPEEDLFPRVSREDCSKCASCRSRSSSYHSLLYDFDTANQFPIYQPTVIDYDEEGMMDEEASEHSCTPTQASEETPLKTLSNNTDSDTDYDCTTPTPESSGNVEISQSSEDHVLSSATKSVSCDIDTGDAAGQSAVDSVDSNGETPKPTGSNQVLENTHKEKDETADSNKQTNQVIDNTHEEDNKTKVMLKLKRDKLLKQSQAAFGSLKDRFRKVKSKV